MFNRIKWAIKINKLYNRIMKIKLIRAVMGLITVLLSYKIIKYFWYFNKLIIYLFGLIFVGVNWSDYHIFKEIKLIYDSVILYFLSFLPSNNITDDIKDSTKNDIKSIIYKDHSNINGEVDQDYIYVIAEKLPEVKSIRNEIKETVITDGQDNIWTMSDKELEISPAVNVDNMSSFQGLTINEMNLTLDKFVKSGLHTIDNFKSYIKVREECFDMDNPSANDIYSDKMLEMKLLQEDMIRLMELTVDESVLSARKDVMMRFEQLYCDIPHKKNMGLIEAVDCFNMYTYPERFNNPEQEVYDIEALSRYAEQLDENLDDGDNNFNDLREIIGQDVTDHYNEIERLNLLPVNSVTNKALYDMYLKLFDLLQKYPSIEPIHHVHRSPFIKPEIKSNDATKLLSIEDIPEL